MAASKCDNWDERVKRNLVEKQDKLESLNTGSRELPSPLFSHFDIVTSPLRDKVTASKNGRQRRALHMQQFPDENTASLDH